MVQGVSSDFQKDGYVSKSEDPKYRELLLQNGISPGDIIDSGGRIRTDIKPEVIDDLKLLRDDLYSKVGNPLFPDVEYDIEILEALMTDIGLNESKSLGIKKLQQALGMGLHADVGKVFETLNKSIQAYPSKWVKWLSEGNNREIFIEALKPYLSNPKYEKQVGALLCNLLTLPDSRGKLMDIARRLFLHVSSTNKAQSGRVLQFIKNPAAIVLLAALSGIGAQDLMLRLGVSARPKEVNEFDRVAKSVQDFGGCLGRINFGNLRGKDKVDHFIAVCKLHADYYAKRIDADQLDRGMADLHFIEDPEGVYDWIHVDEDTFKSLSISKEDNQEPQKINDYGELTKFIKEGIIVSFQTELEITLPDKNQGGKSTNSSGSDNLNIEYVKIKDILEKTAEGLPEESQEDIPGQAVKEDPKTINEDEQ